MCSALESWRCSSAGRDGRICLPWIWSITGCFEEIFLKFVDPGPIPRPDSAAGLRPFSCAAQNHTRCRRVGAERAQATGRLRMRRVPYSHTLTAAVTVQGVFILCACATAGTPRSASCLAFPWCIYIQYRFRARECGRPGVPYHRASEVMYDDRAVHTLQIEISPSLAVKCHSDKSLPEIRVLPRPAIRTFRASAAQVFCGVLTAPRLAREIRIRSLPALA